MHVWAFLMPLFYYAIMHIRMGELAISVKCVGSC